MVRKVFEVIQHRVIKWLLVVLCMVAIFGMSHLDSVKSWYLTGKILTTVTQTQDYVADMDYDEEIGFYSADEQDFGMHLLRKMAHVLEFMVLFLLWVNVLWEKQVLRYRVIERLSKKKVKRFGKVEKEQKVGKVEKMQKVQKVERKTLALAALFTVLYAIFDEVHQLFIVGRTGTVGDVLIDSLGILIGILVIKMLMSQTNKKVLLAAEFSEVEDND